MFGLAISEGGFLSAGMNPEPPFRLFGTAHLVVIGLTAGLPVFFWATARQPGRAGYRRAVRYGLAGLLLANWIAYEVIRARDGQFTPMDALPMQLCDWAMLAVMAALITLRERIYEVAYFWGMAGTLQAILTPNLQEGFPSPRFINFFVSHCGIVVAVMHLTAVEGLRPRPRSIARAMLWSEVYFVTALAVNGLTGANYGFLTHKPLGKSLLDWLSPNHPLYLLELNLLAAAFYLALYSPFWLRDSISAARGRKASRQA
jgi:hypothetical integral membrane protein (TIGR02206 family)